MSKAGLDQRLLLEKQIGYGWSLSLEERRQPKDSASRYDYTSWKGRLRGNTDTLTDAITQIKTAAKTLAELKEAQQQP